MMNDYVVHTLPNGRDVYKCEYFTTIEVSISGVSVNYEDCHSQVAGNKIRFVV